MRRIVTIGVLSLLVLAVSAAAQTNTAIVAGQSVAGIRVGGGVNDAIAVLGNLFDRTETRSGKFAAYDWPLRPFLLIADKESGRVVLVLVNLTDAYRTDRGITGGSDRQTVETSYGREFTEDEDPRSTTLIYNELGIAFDIGKAGVMSGKVRAILIFVPGQWKQITDGM